jgi:EAL domain-containing protein (putative c-di-GMP-specific phosphodiesterase class I)/CheY-like chemotaxis protein
LQLSSVRFLVVEDHDVQRRLLIQILANLGAVSIEEAGDGHAALHVMREAVRPIDVMITDLSMPGMDGIELIRHVGEAGSGISVILTSALEPRLLASVANMAQAYSVKLLGMLKKPPSAVKLAPLIEQYLADKDSARFVAHEQKIAAFAEAFVRDEFEPYYEPTVSLATLEVKGVQAVPVWRHPDKGLLHAGAFVAALKSFGLGDELVLTMLRKCAAQSAAWKARGLNVKVAVNLTLGSLADLELASRIEQIVRGQGAEPGNLVLGVPEAAVDVAPARALENLVRLRVLGFELAIDEFGTGHMAADQVSRIAFNALKISRTFVQTKGRTEPPWMGLAVAIDVAEKLKLAAVADGIATPDDWNLLQELHCEQGQGPLISDPLPGADVPAWLRTWPPPARRGVWTPAPMT